MGSLELDAMYVGQHRLMDSPRTFQICLLFLWHKGSRLTDWDPQHYTHWFKLCRTLWVRNYPHFWLLPHNSSSLGGNAMKFYDFVSEGLIPVLTTIGVFGWINYKSKQTTKLYKTLSMSWVWTHPYSHCRTLARHMSWVWRHPCFAKERNMSLV